MTIFYALFVADSNTYEPAEFDGFCVRGKNNVTFFDNFARAQNRAKRLSQMYPNKEVHLLKSDRFFFCKPADSVEIAFNELGEALPV